MDQLTQRHLEILQLAADGKSRAQTATELGITIRTVDAHLREIYYRLQVNSKIQAVVIGLTKGLIGLPKQKKCEKCGRWK
jgi:DNA-binding NarL/FixJ family response regulator